MTGYSHQVCLSCLVRRTDQQTRSKCSSCINKAAQLSVKWLFRTSVEKVMSVKQPPAESEAPPTTTGLSGRWEGHPDNFHISNSQTFCNGKKCRFVQREYKPQLSPERPNIAQGNKWLRATFVAVCPPVFIPQPPLSPWFKRRAVDSLPAVLKSRFLKTC